MNQPPLIRFAFRVSAVISHQLTLVFVMLAMRAV